MAQGATIDFLAEARLGDELLASAEERRAGRIGCYDISVTNQRGELIAVFRGKSYRLGGQLVEV